MSRLLRTVGLAVVLLWAQWVLAMHGVEHLVDSDHDHEEACVQCLALAGTAPAPPGADTLPVPGAARFAEPQCGVSPRLTFPSPAYFLTRAPPVRRS